MPRLPQDVAIGQRTFAGKTVDTGVKRGTATVRTPQADGMRFQHAFARKLGVNVTPDEARLLGMEVFAAMSGMSKAELR